MNPKHFIIIFLTLIVLGESSTNPEEFYKTCTDSFTCGNISGFRFPFRRETDPAYCGYPGFELNCDEKNAPTINIKNMTYHVKSIDPTAQILKIVREDMIESMCPQDRVNTTMDYTLFDYTSGYINTTLLFGCSVSFNGMGIGPTSCDNNGGSTVFFMPGIHVPEGCESGVVVPGPDRFFDLSELGRVLQDGFEVKWKVGDAVCTGCSQSGGRCVYDDDTRLTACGCPDPPFLADRCAGVNKTRVESSPKPSKELFPILFLIKN
ncbi:hypothetical protein L2E82_18553 [Cichorium intybus]|uniref:Uncharacterized protein n=1 Tax=Cichorium intybus TaxID=13427 RepID=A0ACB9FBC4_CICIN|nr:hypothetical protein L2E82_18553 [Cichorium intybus]